MSKARRRRHFIRWVRYDNRCITAVQSGPVGIIKTVIPDGIGRAYRRVLIDARHRSVRRQMHVWQP